MLLATGALAAVFLAFAGTGSAGALFHQATGEIWMSGPSQYLSFNASDYGANSTLDRGTVTYTNFEYPGGLSCTASVLCATVDSNAGTARFMFQIPDGFPGLSGLYVVASVTDGAHPVPTTTPTGHRRESPGG